MLFEWDENKNQVNISKHGLDFNHVKLIFNEPMLVKKMIEMNIMKIDLLELDT